jgi:hypothetical protein
MRHDADHVVASAETEGHLFVEAGVVYRQRGATAQVFGENHVVLIQRSLESVELHHSEELTSPNERKNKGR